MTTIRSLIASHPDATDWKWRCIGGKDWCLLVTPLDLKWLARQSDDLIEVQPLYGAAVDAPPAQPVGVEGAPRIDLMTETGSVAYVRADLAHPSAAPTDNTALVEAADALFEQASHVFVGSMTPADIRGSAKNLGPVCKAYSEARAALSQPAAPQPTPEVEALREALSRAESDMEEALSTASAARDEGFRDGVEKAAARVESIGFSAAFIRDLIPLSPRSSRAALARGSVDGKGEKP